MIFSTLKKVDYRLYYLGRRTFKLDYRSRPIRSVLYTPGFGKHLFKVRNSIADGALIDLEDGVAPLSKIAAREAVVKFLSQDDVGRRMMIVRVNRLDSEWGWDDLRAVSKLKRVDAIAIPKIESTNEIIEAVDFLEENGVPDDTKIWAFIETAKGVQKVDSIAASHSRVSTLVMGTSDLSKDLNCINTRDRTALLYSLSKCIVAARANNLQILDGVHLNLDDSNGFEISCKQGKELGMDGKTLIHPNTIAVANWYFGPSAEEVEQSYRIVEAMEKAAAEGLGVCVLNGQLIENLHAQNARRIIALHETIQSFEELT